MYRPSELHSFLDQQGLSPKKRLSQNFLIDGNVIRKIIAVADVQPNDLILEIGSGPGSLTQALLTKGAEIIAIEKDRSFAKALERLQTNDQRLHLYYDDILTFPFEELNQFKKEGQKIKVIANLPYHLTTPILQRLLVRNDLFSSCTLMMQEEVAQRVTAQPSTPHYGSLTLFIRFYSHPSYGFGVNRRCFYPIPKVNSAIVRFELHEPPLTGTNCNAFFILTRTAFGHRRKMLRVSLKVFFPSQVIEEALIAIGKNSLARPENLSLEDFLQLYIHLQF
jgi:16S rRNA (adenine1518-N6/adenine1519-N6)-dimethyltransferase